MYQYAQLGHYLPDGHLSQLINKHPHWKQPCTLIGCGWGFAWFCALQLVILLCTADLELSHSAGMVSTILLSCWWTRWPNYVVEMNSYDMHIKCGLNMECLFPNRFDSRCLYMCFVFMWLYIIVLQAYERLKYQQQYIFAAIFAVDIPHFTKSLLLIFWYRNIHLSYGFDMIIILVI